MSTEESPPATGVGVIDCDLHNDLSSVAPLVPYLPDYWVEHFLQSEFKGPSDTYYPPSFYLSEGEIEAVTAAGRAGSAAAETSAAAPPPARRSIPSATPDQLGAMLDRLGTATGLLSCSYAIDSLHNPDQAVALARAVNDWQIAEWLERDPRFRASIVVPIQLPSLAIEEIERVADHRGFVQVMLPARSQHPYGSRLYHELWATLARHDLVAGIHFGGAPGNPPTPVGWPSYYYEEYVDMAGVFAQQVTSLVTEGVFQQVPTLRVTLLESGCTWLPGHLWRFNKDWKNLRSLTPWLKRAPSDYVREHFRLSLEPFDAPLEAAQLLTLVDRLGSEDLLLYSSDFPHRGSGDLLGLIQNGLPPRLATKLLRDNARAWYRLGD